jgi:hypothetical protein
MYMEQARAEAGILMPPLDDVDSEVMKELNADELDEVTKAQGKDSIAKLRVALQSVRCHFSVSGTIGVLSAARKVVYQKHGRWSTSGTTGILSGAREVF